MAITSRRLLASGQSWAAHDVVCAAGPDDRPFEERHDWACIAVVKQGTFQYRTSYGRATLAPGALLLGDAGQCFECSHEHGIGDRCLSFHFAPDYFERIVADVRGAGLPFTVPRFAPSESLIPLLVAADPAPHDAMELEEIALRLAGLVATRLSRTATSAATPSRHNERRMSEAVRRLEADPETPTTLTALARNCGMSPYHFLRTFRSVVGITPHQFVLAQRLRRAAVRLRESDEPISRIVFDAGFNDLSTFNRRFRRVMGATPTAFRRVRHRALPRLPRGLTRLATSSTFPATVFGAARGEAFR